MNPYSQKNWGQANGWQKQHPAAAAVHRPAKKRRSRGGRSVRLLVFLVLVAACAGAFALLYTKVFSIKGETPQAQLAGTPGPTPLPAGAEAAEGSPLLQQLEALLPGLPQAAAILENPAHYPEELLELLLRNPETIDFVLGYPTREEGGDFQYEAGGGGMPHLLQWDPRWGYHPYGDSMMALSGCAPTCLAMVSARLTGNPAHSPPAIAKMSEEAGYYMPGTGTAWALMTEGCRALGLEGRELPLEEGALRASLEAGSPIICCVRPGDFTTAGHLIVLWGVDEGGAFLVKDPNSINNTNRSWTYEELAPQIRNLWAYTAL